MQGWRLDAGSGFDVADELRCGGVYRADGLPLAGVLRSAEHFFLLGLFVFAPPFYLRHTRTPIFRRYTGW